MYRDGSGCRPRYAELRDDGRSPSVLEEGRAASQSRLKSRSSSDHPQWTCREFIGSNAQHSYTIDVPCTTTVHPLDFSLSSRKPGLAAAYHFSSSTLGGWGRPKVIHMLLRGGSKTSSIAIQPQPET